MRVNESWLSWEVVNSHRAKRERESGSTLVRATNSGQTRTRVRQILIDFRENLSTFKVEKSAWESKRVRKSSMPNESESLNSHQLSFSLGPGFTYVSILHLTPLPAPLLLPSPPTQPPSLLLLLLPLPLPLLVPLTYVGKLHLPPPPAPLLLPSPPPPSLLLLQFHYCHYHF